MLRHRAKSVASSPNSHGIRARCSPGAGFIVTDVPMEADWIVRLDHQRGTTARHNMEGNCEFGWTRLSCRRFRDNEVRLQKYALTYNVAKSLHGTGLPEVMADWPLTSLQLKLIKIAARVVHHARTITVQLVEVAVKDPVVRAILALVWRLRAPPLCA